MSFMYNENCGREINLQARLTFLRDLLKGIYSHSEVRKDRICPLVREVKILLTTDGKLWRNALYVVSCIITSFHLETYYGFLPCWISVVFILSHMHTLSVYVCIHIIWFYKST